MITNNDNDNHDGNNHSDDANWNDNTGNNMIRKLYQFVRNAMKWQTSVLLMVWIMTHSRPIADP